jgi:phage gpG-like protein
MITVTIDGVENTVIRLQGFPAKLQESLSRTMMQIVIGLQSYIRTRKLVGGNPLNQRSGNLSRAITYQVKQESDGVTGIVGVDSTAPYGKVHEYGGTITIREHIAHSRKGNPYSVRSHTATYPVRSFLRSSLDENRQDIMDQLRKAVNDAIHEN